MMYCMSVIKIMTAVGTSNMNPAQFVLFTVRSLPQLHVVGRCHDGETNWVNFRAFPLLCHVMSVYQMVSFRTQSTAAFSARCRRGTGLICTSPKGWHGETAELVSDMQAVQGLCCAQRLDQWSVNIPPMWIGAGQKGLESPAFHGGKPGTPKDPAISVLRSLCCLDCPDPLRVATKSKYI